MASTTFDLLIPSSGEGPTHLREAYGVGILCGSYTRRYATFTQAGIVPAGSATCERCNLLAGNLARAIARRT